MCRRFEPGARVIYCVPKRSARPGPNAKGVYPAPHGDDYSYYVEKFWTVIAVLPEGKIIACTRRGKQHTLRADDPALRPARWWERILFAKRFPGPAQVGVPVQSANAIAPDLRPSPPITPGDPAAAESPIALPIEQQAALPWFGWRQPTVDAGRGESTLAVG